MSSDRRAGCVDYYELQDFQNDQPFYEARIPSPDGSILDLGCGTGRLLVPLASKCAYIHGIELSASMLDRCLRKMRSAGLDSSHAVAEQGNISDFDLARTFDLIIAPFRVFQALESDAQVEGCLQCIRRHLAADGTAILSMFNPMLPPGRMRTDWVTSEEKLDFEKMVDGERIVCLDRRPRLDPEKLVLYPDLIYRRYNRDDVLVEEVVMPIVMRCWYADQIIELLESNGFEIVGRWGGYEGEEWGDGSELVVQFRAK